MKIKSNISAKFLPNYYGRIYLIPKLKPVLHICCIKIHVIENLTRKLSEKLKAEAIVITRGNNGSIAYENNTFYKCPAYANKIVDRIGAGDTLFAITSLVPLKVGNVKSR